MKCDIDFNGLRDRAFATAKAHGWHDQELSDNHWRMMVITEVSEAVEADRKGRHADLGKFLTNASKGDCPWNVDFEIFIKNSVEDELCDVVIRCLDLGGLRGIDFDRTNKMLKKLKLRDMPCAFTEIMFDICGVLTNGFYNLSYVLCLTIAAVIAYCDSKGIDIEWFINQKMKYNEMRSFKHGGKSY